MKTSPLHFDNLIVDAGLLPLRDRAGRGELSAMIELAAYLIEGEEAAKNVTVLEQLADALLDHPEATHYSAVYCQIILVQARLFELQWKTGNLTTEQYHRGTRGMMVLAVQTMTKADYRHWDLPILQGCLAWLEAHPQEDPELV